MALVIKGHCGVEIEINDLGTQTVGECVGGVKQGTSIHEVRGACSACVVWGKTVPETEVQAAGPGPALLPTLGAGLLATLPGGNGACSAMPAPVLPQGSEFAAQQAPEPASVPVPMTVPTLGPGYRGPICGADAPGTLGEVLDDGFWEQTGQIFLVAWQGAATSWHPAAHLQVPGTVQPAQPVQPPMVPAQPVAQVPEVPSQATADLSTPAAPMYAPAEVSATSLPMPALPVILPEDYAGIDIESVLRQAIPDCPIGSSKGGFSSHVLEPVPGCMRKAFMLHVLGVRAFPPARHFQLGTLYHACKALHYLSSGQRTLEPCTVVRNAGEIELAQQVAELLHAENKRFGYEEATRWSIRAVEQQDVFWSEPIKICGKLVQLPFTMRIDLLIALLAEAGAAHPAPNAPVPGGVHQVDYKTAKAMTWEVTQGYMTAPQFKHNAVVYSKGQLRPLHGDLGGTVVHVAVKHKVPTPEKSFFRVYADHDHDSSEMYYRQEMLPGAARLYEGLVDPALRSNENAWPGNSHYCSANFGCDYRGICRHGARWREALDRALQIGNYRVDPERIITVDTLLPPPLEVKRAAVQADPTRRALADKQRERVDARKRIGEVLAQHMRTLGKTEGWQVVQAERYLVAGHTEADVKKLLATNLAQAWPSGPLGKLTLELGHEQIEVAVEVKERGLSWKCTFGAGLKASGQVTWKNLAEVICADWWALDKLTPINAQPPPRMVPQQVTTQLQQAAPAALAASDASAPSVVQALAQAAAMPLAPVQPAQPAAPVGPPAPPPPMPMPE